MDQTSPSQRNLHIRLGSWAELAPAARVIRLAVFVEEQHVPIELEWDEEDATAVHAIANCEGVAVGTARLLPASSDHEDCARIGRMAVLPEFRGLGIGDTLLRTLMAHARARGDRGIVLHAQCHAAAFYERAGFQPHGATFDEAGIPHIEMRLLWR